MFGDLANKQGLTRFQKAAEDLEGRMAAAHRRAEHDGPRATCCDDVCAAFEDWLHHHTRPPLRGDAMENMVRG